MSFSINCTCLLREDTDFFTRITSTAATDRMNAVILGRRTWESIPKKFRPLSNRINIVISGTLNSVPEGVYLAKDFSNALAICENLHSDNKVDEVFVIGGTAVYEAALNQSKYPIRFYCTHVMKDYQCDVFFPDVDWKSFKEIRLPTVEPDIKHCGDVDIRFAVYEKAQN